MADSKTTGKVRFLVPVRFGFKEDTPGFEARNLGDEYVYTKKDFKEGDEFDFPAAEVEAVKQLIADGFAVRVGGEKNPRAELAESHKDETVATPVPDTDADGKPLPKSTDQK